MATGTCEPISTTAHLLGSKANQEARIDSLSQSWGVISGGASRERSEQALNSAERELVKRRRAAGAAFHSALRSVEPRAELPASRSGLHRGVPAGGQGEWGPVHACGDMVGDGFCAEGGRRASVGLLNMLNPVEHARTPEEVERYKVEPYVVAADVYALPGQIGRGGWTWYTGSAGGCTGSGSRRCSGSS